MIPSHPLHRFGPALAIVFLAILFYLPSLNGVYIWDDEPWLTKNTSVQAPNGLSQIWLDVDANPQYYPLVFTTFWIEYHLWGLGTLGPDNFHHAPGYHIDNILLHMLTCLLLFHLIKKLKLPGGTLGAWIATALFAVHPVNVESVAWIAERKNVLCAVFFFASLLYALKCFRVIDGTPSSPKPFNKKHYLLALFLFLLAMLSKTTACVLPPAVLLMLWWRNGRIARKEFILSLPFFLIAAAMSLITVHTEHGDTVGARGIDWICSPLARTLYQHPDQATLPLRLLAAFQEFLAHTLIAGQDLWFYILKLFWPFPLMQIYPRFSYNIYNPLLYLAPLSFLLLLILLFLLRKRITRGPLTALLFFAGTLFPALGFIRFYTEIYTFVADHYQYFSCIAIIVLVVETLLFLLKRAAALVPTDDPVRFLKLSSALIAAGLILPLGTLTLANSSLYQSAEALWRFNTEMNPNAYPAWTSLASAVLQRPASTPQQKTDAENEAILDLKKSIALAPNDWLGYQNLGKIYLQANMLDQAIDYLAKGEALEPPSMRKHAADLLAQQTSSIDINATDASSQIPPSIDFLLGQNAQRQGKLDDAIAAFNRDLAQHPQNAADLTELAACCILKNDNPAAEQYARKALALRPTDAPAWFYLALSLRFSHPEEGRQALNQARTLDPQLPLHIPAAIQNTLTNPNTQPAP